MTKTDPIISLKNVTKKYDVIIPSSGFYPRIRSFFLPKYQSMAAADNISFDIMKGERVAFIGPNGAGKSTTIKMMTGILHPNEGKVTINGLDPILERRSLANSIGAIIGHRSQLWYHLPAIKSFELLATIYSIPKLLFHKKLNELSSLLKLDKIIHSPVKELSLGQRMRCELAASLIHNPDIIFLDEPTIGLDIVSKMAIREFIKTNSENQGTSIFLTSHDTSDIEAICDRAIIIDKGKIIMDAKISDIKTRFRARDNENVQKEVLLNQPPIDAISIAIESQSLEEIIKQIYKGM